MRCGLRLLIDDRVPLSMLVSLDTLRSKIKPERLDGLLTQLFSPAERQSRAPLEDAFTACVTVLSARAAILLYVADRSGTFGFQIRPEAIRDGCCCWSLSEAVAEGRFITKPTLMRHNSREAELDGQPIYVKESVANKVLQRRPTSYSRLTTLIKDVVDRAAKQGVVLTNAEIVEQALAHPDVWGASKRQIMQIARSLKPKEWSMPGRPPRSPKKS
jgi:hypothetical protein